MAACGAACRIADAKLLKQLLDSPELTSMLMSLLGRVDARVLCEAALWTDTAASALARQLPDDRQIFVFQGHLAEEVSLRRFEPGSGKWTQLPRFSERPGAAGGADVLTIGRSLYLCNVPELFRTCLEEQRPSVYRLDAGATQWRPLPALSTQRLHCGAFAHKGLLYICGGTLARPWETDCWDEERWRSCCGDAAEHGEQFHGFLWAAERYDPATDDWETLAPMHRSRARSLVGLSLRGELYIFGGEHECAGKDGGFPLNDPTSAERFGTGWEQLPSLRLNVVNGCCRSRPYSVAAVADQVFLLDQDAAALQRLDSTAPAAGWQQVPQPQVRRYDALMVRCGNALLLCGGYTHLHGANFVMQRELSSMVRYDLGSECWETLPWGTSFQASALAATALGDALYIFGNQERRDQDGSTSHESAVVRVSPRTGESSEVFSGRALFSQTPMQLAASFVGW